MSQRPTTPDGNRNFASSSSKNQEQKKQDSIKKNLEDNKWRSQNAKNNKKDIPKINQNIAAGKAFLDKFIQGFTSVKRANITSDLDDTLPFRYSEVYQQMIQSYCESEDFSELERKARSMNKDFVGAISIGMAIKLNKAAPELEKKSNFLLSAINSVKLKLPKKLSVLIDQLGKTDLPNDNHFRLNNQNFAAKRHLVRGLLFIHGDKEIEGYLADSSNYTINDFKTKIGVDSKFCNMVDNSNWSLERIHQIGKDTFNVLAQQNVKFTSSNKEWTFRLPHFEVKEDTTIEDIGKYVSNAIFTDFTFSTQDVIKICSGLILQVAPVQWIRQSNKTMKELNKAFDKSFLSDQTFDTLMDHCDVWNVNSFLSDTDINDLAVSAIHKWNSGKIREFEKFMEIGEIEFSEYGTEAQLIQVDSDKVSQNKDSFFDINTFKIKGKAKSFSPLKTSNNNALLGLISRYTKNVHFSSDFEINHDKTNRQILYEFLKNDAKTR